MDFSKLPTDSLYKFIAIFGLLLVVFGFWQFDKAQTVLSSAIDEYYSSFNTDIMQDELEPRINQPNLFEDHPPDPPKVNVDVYSFTEDQKHHFYHRLKEDDLWAALAALADNLLAHETLEGEQVEEIVGAWLG
jgi:hypothetical protein